MPLWSEPRVGDWELLCRDASHSPSCPWRLSSHPHVCEAGGLRGHCRLGVRRMLQWPELMAGRHFSRLVWWGPILSAAVSLWAYMTSLLCDKVPIWGLLSSGGLSGLEILPCSDHAGKPSRGGYLAPSHQAEAPGMPTEAQIWALSSRAFTRSRCYQDFPLWPSKSPNTVRMMSSFILRIGRLWCSNYYAQVNIFPITAVWLPKERLHFAGIRRAQALTTCPQRY